MRPFGRSSCATSAHGTLGNAGISFPTPALSLGERENRSPSSSPIRAWYWQSAAGTAHEVRRLFPLPEGERQSEGEHDGLPRRRRDQPGHYLALFHDHGRFFAKASNIAKPPVMTLYQNESHDGGLTWKNPYALFASSEIHLCEPGLIRSPDGKQLSVLVRENRRRRNSHVIFSNDEGRTWSPPRELPAALTGDRHVGKYAPDGRLFISFRDMTRMSATRGDWVGWVGTYEDIVAGRDGQYRVRIMDNTKDADCAYPGVEVLPDGAFVTTTYGHWTMGESPYVVSVRFTLAALDAKLKTAVGAP